MLIVVLDLDCLESILLALSELSNEEIKFGSSPIQLELHLVLFVVLSKCLVEKMHRPFCLRLVDLLGLILSI